jgi:argininosuccinate synthase
MLLQSYYDSIIKYLIYGNVLKNNTYPLKRKRRKIEPGACILQSMQKN